MNDAKGNQDFSKQVMTIILYCKNANFTYPQIILCKQITDRKVC